MIDENDVEIESEENNYNDIKELEDIEDFLPKKSKISECDIKNLIDKARILNDENNWSEKYLQSNEEMSIIVISIFIFENIIIWTQLKNLLAFFLKWNL